jgi:hypothetical protein
MMCIPTPPKSLMPTFQQLPHVIASLLLLARIGDVGSTYLISPQLKLEANPLARRFRWPFAALTLLLAAIPYYSLPIGIAALILSLLVCASNCSRIWFVRTMGEAEYYSLIIDVARRVPPGLGIVYCLFSPLCMVLIGGVILLFYPDRRNDWAYYFALGFFIYAFAIAFYGTLTFLRYRREGIALHARST